MKSSPKSPYGYHIISIQTLADHVSITYLHQLACLGLNILWLRAVVLFVNNKGHHILLSIKLF